MLTTLSAFYQIPEWEGHDPNRDWGDYSAQEVSMWQGSGTNDDIKEEEEEDLLKGLSDTDSFDLVWSDEDVKEEEDADQSS